MMQLPRVFYKLDDDFKDSIKNHEKTMWLFSTNDNVKKKMWKEACPVVQR